MINGLMSEELVVNPHLVCLPYSDDEILVKHGSRSSFSRVIKDQGHTRLMGKLIHHFKTGNSLRKLIDQGAFQNADVENLEQAIEYLKNENILVPAHLDPARIYLDTFMGRSSALSAVSIGLVGTAFLGSRIAEELARINVKEIVGLDDRECLDATQERRYFSSLNGSLQNGCSYSEIVGMQLSANHYAAFSVVQGSMSDEANVRAVFERVGFLIVALESYSPFTLHRVNKVAIELRKPWMAVSMDGSEARIGPIFIPGETCCFNEADIQHIASAIDVKDDYFTFREDSKQRSSTSIPPVLPPYLSAAAGMAVSGLLRYIATGTSFLIERCIRMDFERLTIDYETIMRLPRCPACSVNKPYRHMFL